MKKTASTLAALTLALGVTACSSGGDTSGSPSSSSTSTSSTASPSSPDPLQAPPSDAAEAKADAAKEAAASEAVPEDGGMPGGGLGEEEFTTKDYLEDVWAMAGEADDESAGMMCLIFRSEPDAEFGLGEDALIDSIEAEVEGIDREEARDFFDDKCPTADEIEAASEGGQ